MLVLSIVSHRQTLFVDRLLEDLCPLADVTPFFVVLVLNVADEPIPSNWLAFPASKKLLIRNESPLGFGENHNKAFKAIGLTDHENDLWCMLNPDLRIPDVSVFQVLRSALTGACVLAAPSIIENGEVAASARKLYTPMQAVKAFLGWKRQLVMQPDWLAGMFLMMRSADFRRLNGFDERYFMYCEDVDLSLRVLLSGGTLCYRSDVHVLHAAQRDSRKSFRSFGVHLMSCLKLWFSPVFWRFLRHKLR
jgi:N-acetylglucosaminyl-diphospho-decaprenol L-rhamnosyltransferase